MAGPVHLQVPNTGNIYLQPGWRFRASREGLASLTMRFRGPTATFISGLIPVTIGGINYGLNSTYRAPNPLYTGMGVYSVDITSGKGANNLGTLEIEWRGLNPGLKQLPPPIYELDRSTGNEPLETHPKWVTDIAGKPSAPLNAAIFIDGNGAITTDDTLGTFKEFAAVIGGDKNPWIGRSDYLVAGSIFKKTYCSSSPPSNMGQVGTFSAPDGPAPSPPSGYAWFYLGESSTDESALYRISGSWRLVPTDAAAKIIYSQ